MNAELFLKRWGLSRGAALRRRLSLCLVSCGSQQGLADDRSGGVVDVALCSATFVLIGASLIILYPHSHTHIQIRQQGNGAACIRSMHFRFWGVLAPALGFCMNTNPELRPSLHHSLSVLRKEWVVWPGDSANPPVWKLDMVRECLRKNVVASKDKHSKLHCVMCA